MHEILTLQFGPQSNYVGTHFWNAQESYFTYGSDEESAINHDVSFRTGVGADGSDTFLPRTVIYDFKSSFGTLRKINELYEVLGDEPRQSNSWGGNVATQLQPSLHQTDYQRALNEGLDAPRIGVEHVRFWSDYSRVYYHPRSIVQIYETEINPERRSFHDWTDGEQLFSKLDAEHDLLDRDLRPFAEECDQLQGLQVLTGVGSAWGAFAARYVDRICDELGKTSIWTWGLDEGPAESLPQRRAKIVNEARALHDFSTQSTIYIPLASSVPVVPNYLNINARIPWHTSALQMTALESFTLPSRLLMSERSSATSLDALASALSPAGDRRIVQLSFEAIEADQSHAANGVVTSGNNKTMRSECNLFRGMEANPVSNDGHVFSEVEVFRGEESAAQVITNGNGRQGDGEHDFRRFRSSLAFPLLDSFPQIYSLLEPSTRSTPISSRAKTSSSIGNWVRSLKNSARLLIGVEEREVITNGLQEIAEAYDHGFNEDMDEWSD